MTRIFIFCGYCVWLAYDLPSDADAFSLTSFEMLNSSLRLNEDFRLFSFCKVPPGSEIIIISDFLFVCESDSFLQCSVTLGPAR